MVKVTLSIEDAQAWRDFRAECMRRGLGPGKEILRMIREQLEKWAAEARHEG